MQIHTSEVTQVTPVQPQQHGRIDKKRFGGKGLLNELINELQGCLQNSPGYTKSVNYIEYKDIFPELYILKSQTS